jgi:hypothetical protein
MALPLWSAPAPIKPAAWIFPGDDVDTVCIVAVADRSQAAKLATVKGYKVDQASPSFDLASDLIYWADGDSVILLRP